MDAVTKASRAILAEFARRTLRPFEYVAVGIFVVAVLGTTYLIAQVSGWWWFLMIAIIAYGVIGSIVWLILHFTMDKLRPEQNLEQKEAVRKFITRVNSVSDTLQITRFGLILRILQDVMSRGQRNVLGEITKDSSALKGDFERVVDLFR